MKKLLLLLCVSTITTQTASGQEITADVPDYTRMMLANALLPGTAQRQLGKADEALRYYPSLPMSVVGAGMIVAATIVGDGELAFDLESNESGSYLVRYTGEESLATELLVYGGLILSLYGNLLSAYSSYGAHRDFVDIYGDPFRSTPYVSGRLSLRDAFFAPFKPEHVFSIDVLPMLGLMTLGGFSIDEWRSILSYFNHTRVDFFSIPVSAAAALLGQSLISTLMTTATAAWEELMFRGLSLEVNGSVHSSVSFGLSHLANMLVPGVSVEETLAQSIYATAFGFYAADRVLQRNFRIERMIALHYWHNFLSLLLGFMADPESEKGLSIKYIISF